jgi:hypothetical protein
MTLDPAGDFSTAEWIAMNRTKHGLRRLAALLVGCGAAGLVIGWSYAERPSITSGYSRPLSR